MNMINENGFVEIPITDPAHLKKIIITGDVKSSAGSSWGSAGCAVCINAVTPDGTAFWTSKGYSLTLGTGSKAIVEFDGTLQNKDKEDVAAVVADGKIELQKWWDASEKQEAEIADEITVQYTKVEVVYEYSGSQLTGDINDDGKFDALDASALRDFLTDNTAPANWEAGDLDENGRLNAADLTLMKRMLIYG